MSVQKWSPGRELAGGGRRHAETVSAGATSDSIIIEPGERPTVTIRPGGGGTAIVQFTTSTHEAMFAGTADWDDWDLGTVSAAASRRLAGDVRGLRATATTAAADWIVIA